MVQGMRQHQEQSKAEAANSKRPPRYLGRSQSLRGQQQITFQGALDDLLEIIECKVSDEEIRTLAKRVERATERS